MIGDYLIILGELAVETLSETWTRAEQRAGVQIWTKGAQPPAFRWIGAEGLLIGEVFCGGRALPAGIQFRDAAPRRVCERLLQQVWGRYVAVFPRGPEPLVFRDPSGGLECVVWRIRQAIIITSARLLDLPDDLRPIVTLDWNRLALMLATPVAAGGSLALSGVEAVTPGACLKVRTGPGVMAQLWSPHRFVDPTPIDDATAAAALVAEAEAAVGAYAAAGQPALAEVSGGLDSSIVASLLAASRGQQVRVWLNNRTDHPRGDERPYAQAVAKTAAIALTELEKDATPLDETAWRDLTGAWRPPFAGLDARRDATFAALCQARGLTQIFTGQGGDIVFYQEPAPQILAEGLRPLALARMFRTADRLARWTRRSGWSVLRRGLGGARIGLRATRPPILNPDLDLKMRHPWLDEGSVPAAKRIQIFGLAALLNRQTPSLRGRVAEILNPLLAQPLVELCLRLPARQLTDDGRRDRALARSAFRGRVPDLVLQRSAKGELNQFYGHHIADSLGYLRPLLLDGVLVRQGVLQRAVLETALTRENLLVGGDYAVILQAAMLETWAAGWMRSLAA